MANPMQPAFGRNVHSVVGQVRHVVVLLLLFGCNAGVDGDPDFGSGSSPASAGTPSSESSSSQGDAAGGNESGSAGDTEPTTSSNPTSGASDASGSTSSAEGETAADAGDETTSNGSTDDTGTGAATSAGGTPLDPDLDVPVDGEPCTVPGSSFECPAVSVCRFHTAEEGRCESCDECGNLNAPCSVGTDCDILFACYAGRCTNICELGTFYCGPVEDCLDIGHPTHGVCNPFA